MRWRGSPNGDRRAELELRFDAQIGARSWAVEIDRGRLPPHTTTRHINSQRQPVRPVLREDFRRCNASTICW
jgi:hypothetical protein